MGRDFIVGARRFFPIYVVPTKGVQIFVHSGGVPLWLAEKSGSHYANQFPVTRRGTDLVTVIPRKRKLLSKVGQARKHGRSRKTSTVQLWCHPDRFWLSSPTALSYWRRLSGTRQSWRVPPSPATVLPTTLPTTTALPISPRTTTFNHNNRHHTACWCSDCEHAFW